MTIMYGDLYKALREANVSEDTAQKASQEVASFETRFNKIDRDMAVLRAMHGVTLAVVLALGIKAFF
jgi:hypothetical protein